MKWCSPAFGFRSSLPSPSSLRLFRSTLPPPCNAQASSTLPPLPACLLSSSLKMEQRFPSFLLYFEDGAQQLIRWAAPCSTLLELQYLVDFSIGIIYWKHFDDIKNGPSFQFDNRFFKNNTFLFNASTYKNLQVASTILKDFLLLYESSTNANASSKVTPPAYTMILSINQSKFKKKKSDVLKLICSRSAQIKQGASFQTNLNELMALTVVRCGDDHCLRRF